MVEITGEEIRRLVGRVCADMNINREQLAKVWLGYDGPYGRQVVWAFIKGKRKASYSQVELLRALEQGYRPRASQPPAGSA